MMIPHHQSAIDAAMAAATRAQRAEVEQLAQEMVAAQQKEIEQMLPWRRPWYGASMLLRRRCTVLRHRAALTLTLSQRERGRGSGSAVRHGQPGSI